uniref:Reverse transcriptase domain-containing protein n=1 Tax=Kryptolebias marmoratus TaxID=37003 RepID=A0A3Q3A5T6_KRYMA
MHEPKLPPPENFSGESEQCRPFLTQCEIHFQLQPSSFPSERCYINKCTYLPTLSPLMFNIAIEPLAAALRNDLEVMGINRAGKIFTVSLYADDLLLFLADPYKFIPKAIKPIEEFGRISGYLINKAKCLIFPVIDKANQLPPNSFPFTVRSEKFAYLEVNITRNYKDLFKHNFNIAFNQFMQDMECWSFLPLSLAGRINSVKMVLMPKLLFLFQTIPIFIPNSFFKKLEKITFMYIWNENIPRIRKEFLERRKEEGGLDMPNYMHFYWAANVCKLCFWFKPAESKTVSVWSLMEQNSCKSGSLASVVCSPQPLDKRLITINPITLGAIKIWE